MYSFLNQKLSLIVIVNHSCHWFESLLTISHNSHKQKHIIFWEVVILCMFTKGYQGYKSNLGSQKRYCKLNKVAATTKTTLGVRSGLSLTFVQLYWVLLFPSLHAHTFLSLNLQQLLLFAGTIFLFTTIILYLQQRLLFKLQQLFFICSSFFICSVSPVGHHSKSTSSVQFMNDVHVHIELQCVSSNFVFLCFSEKMEK